MVGHGVDPADAPDYAAHNDLGTAVLLAAMHAAGRAPAGAGRLDGRLRRGPLRLPASTASSGPDRAARADLDAGRFEPRCPRCGRDLVPGLVARGRAARPAQHLRRHQARPGAPGRGVGAADRRGGVVAALPQRLRAADAARHPVRRGRVDLPVGAGTRRGAAGPGGRPPAPRLRARHRRRRGQRPRADDRPARGRPHRRQRLLGRAAHVGDLAGALAAAIGGPEPVVVGGARPGDVRHVVADPARAAGAARVPGRGRASPRGCARSPPIRCALRPGRPTSPNGKRPGPSAEAVGPEDRDVDVDPEIMLPVPGRGRRAAGRAGRAARGLARARRGQRLHRRHRRRSPARSGARVVAEPRRGLRRRRARRAGGARGPSWSRCSTATARSTPRCCPALAAASPRATPISPSAAGCRRAAGVAVARPRRQRRDRRAAAAPGRAGARHRPDPGRRAGPRCSSWASPTGRSATRWSCCCAPGRRAGGSREVPVPYRPPGRRAGRRSPARCAARSGRPATWPGCCDEGTATGRRSRCWCSPRRRSPGGSRPGCAHP